MAAPGAAVVVAGVVVALGALMAFAWAAHAEKALLELQDRQLWAFVSNTADIFMSIKMDGRLSIRPQDDTRRQRLACGRPGGCCNLGLLFS